MIPKGHKKGCRCVVCKNLRKGRAVRRNHGYENQMGAAMRAIRKNSTVPMGGTARTGRANRRAVPMPAGNPDDDFRDPDAWDWKVNELQLYLENTGELYPDMQLARKNLLRKYRDGRLTDGHFTAFKPVINKAARMYAREIDPTVVFPASARTRVAKALLSDFRVEAKGGELDYLLPKMNPAHYPRTRRGPKGNARWFILDLYGRSGKISTRVQKGVQAKLEAEAAGLVNRRVGKHMVRKVELSGPYARQPTASTKRK